MLENASIGMVQGVSILASNYGDCEQCGTRLARINHTSATRKRKLGLCHECIRFPNDEFRCTYIYPESHPNKQKRGKRCGLHKVEISKKEYCGVHKRLMEDKE